MKELIGNHNELGAIVHVETLAVEKHIAEKNSNIPCIFDLSWSAADRLVHHPMAISQETPLSKRDKADFNVLGSENIFFSVYVVLDVLVAVTETMRGDLYLRLCFEFHFILISI